MALFIGERRGCFGLRRWTPVHGAWRRAALVRGAEGDGELRQGAASGERCGVGGERRGAVEAAARAARRGEAAAAGVPLGLGLAAGLAAAPGARGGWASRLGPWPRRGAARFLNRYRAQKNE